MEGHSSATSAIAVISLTALLLDGIQKLHKSWKLVVDVPSYILTVIEDLRLLNAILNDIRAEIQPYSPDLSLNMFDVLISCQNKVNELNTIISQFEAGGASRETTCGCGMHDIDGHFLG